MAAGITEGLTVKLWEHINAHPGLTVDELVQAAKDGDDSPVRQPGLRPEAQRHGSPGNDVKTVTSFLPSTVDPVKAARSKVVDQLGKMRQYGSIRRDDEGLYFAVRPLKRRNGSAALVQPPDVVRADIAMREVRIQFRRLLKANPDGPASNSRMPVALWRALKTWVELDRQEYDEAQRVGG